MKELPQRKRIRLKNYDYSETGAYFITICTHNRIPYFGSVGADSISARMISQIFTETMDLYENIHYYKYVIMPNHIHAIIILKHCDSEQRHTICEIVQTFKRRTTIESSNMVKQRILPPFDKKIWQRSFHDHIIRTEKRYHIISNYIDMNPTLWEKDRFYTKL